MTDAQHSSPSPSLSLVRKGAFIEETYRVFALWDLQTDLRQNLARLRSTNPIGAKNNSWLGEVLETISARFSKGEDFTPLVKLAAGGLTLDTWKYCLLWHLGSTDGLYCSFVNGFLFPKVQEGIAVITTQDVMPFVVGLRKSGVARGGLSDAAVERLSQDLLRLAGQFGFFEGKVHRRIRNPVIPEDAILYAIYSLRDSLKNLDQFFNSDRWKLFMLQPPQVEQELLNLHQFRRLHYERAGSIRALSLPHTNLMDFAQSLVA